jgi:hypothetical protein
VVNKDRLRKRFSKRYHQAVSEKLILAGMVKEFEGIYDEGEMLAGKSTVIILNKSNRYSLKFLLGILNSKLMNKIFLIKNKHTAMSGGYLNVNVKNISELPFIELDLNEQSKKFLHDKMVKLVDQMLHAQKQLRHAITDNDKLYYKRKCEEIDKEIDTLVFQLYGLTPEEIDIIEHQK